LYTTENIFREYRHENNPGIHRRISVGGGGYNKKIDRKEIEKAINILFDAWKNGKRIYLMGCGGSASAASHFAADLSKTAIVPGKRGLRR